MRSFQFCGVRFLFCQVDLISFANSEQFQTIHQPLPDTVHRCRHHFSFSHCVASGLVDSQISFHWRIVAWSGLPFTLPVVDIPVVVFVVFLPLPEASCPEVNGNLELSLMSPQAMSDAYAFCVTVWFLFQTHLFRRLIGSRVDHSANCPLCMVGIRPRCPRRRHQFGCSVHSSLWVCCVCCPFLFISRDVFVVVALFFRLPVGPLSPGDHLVASLREVSIDSTPYCFRWKCGFLPRL